MNLLVRVNRKFLQAIGLIKIASIKLMFGNRFYVGRKPQIKKNARIDIFDVKGRIEIGDHFSMGFNSELFSWNERLKIGSLTSINDNCKIYGDVSIGSNCLFASNIFVSSGTHTFAHLPSLPIKSQDKLNVISKKVVIEDDCWIGFGVVIMPGVYIGKGAIIGSNSVVTKDVFPYSIQGGVPSREISKRLDFSAAYSELKCDVAAHWPFFYRGCDYTQFDDLENIKQGIRIINNPVFLLSKSLATKLSIVGKCGQPVDVKIFLNNGTGTEFRIEKGKFQLMLNLETKANDLQSDYEQLSKEIKETFNVLMFQINTSKDKAFEVMEIISLGLV